MRKLATILGMTLVYVNLFSQAPQKLSFQAVIRNPSDQIIANQQIGMRISVLQGSETGIPVYVETQTPTTNINGLANIEIGSGTTTDDFSVINWANGTYFIKTEIAIAAPLTTYTITGTSQVLSVPYALYAQKAHDIDYNFIISGISDIKLNKNSTVSIPIYIHWINGEQKNVTLSTSDVPTGVILQFEKSDGKPDFASKINIVVSNNAVAGKHIISIIGTADSGRIRVYSFELDVLTTLSAELTIKDATSWSAENLTLNNIQGATIKVFASQSSFNNNLPDFTTTSDINGIAQLYDLPIQDQYFLVVEKGDLSNIKDGYLIGGVFNDPADISSWAIQTGAVVGGLKYIDINADGIINSYDKFWHDIMSVYEFQTTTKTVIIGK